MKPQRSIARVGEVQWMTAGRGIIHGENVMTKGKVRLLQLWLTVPKDQRRTTPGFQTIQADAVPVRREAGVEVRIYSGASGSLRSTTRNHVPVTMTEIKMDPHTSIDQELPTSTTNTVPGNLCG
jgi:redox-sensitive bicupin YhaK (pirin superfamily)